MADAGGAAAAPPQPQTRNSVSLNDHIDFMISDALEMNVESSASKTDSVNSAGSVYSTDGTKSKFKSVAWRRLSKHTELKRQVSFSDVTQIGETYERYTDYFSEYDRTPRYRRGKRLTEGDRRAIVNEVEELRNELFPDGRRYGDRNEASIAAVVTGMTFIKKLKYNYHKHRKSSTQAPDEKRPEQEPQPAGFTQSAEELPSSLPVEGELADGFGGDSREESLGTPQEMMAQFQKDSDLITEQLANMGIEEK